MSDENTKNEEPTKQELKIEDLPVDESKQDEVKGGPQTMSFFPSIS